MIRRRSAEVVVITGASAGLGRATARAFARRGARIGLLARGEERLEDTRREVAGLGGEAMALLVDVANFEQVEAAAAAVETRFGALDVWVNNAMVSVFSPVEEMRAEEYRRVTEVTYLGTVHGTLAALRRMLPRDRGVIVQVGSALAYRAIPLQSAYCAAKHAVQGFTESLRTELYHGGSGVRVCMLQMPALNTPQFEWVRSRLPRKAKPVPYLAHTGFHSQQTEQPEDPSRLDNLWGPVPGHQGAHGAFDASARGRSLQLWASEHRGAVTLGGIALTMTAWGAARQLGLAQSKKGRGHDGPDR